MAEKQNWEMPLEWFDKCTQQDFKNGATISAIRDVIKHRDTLKTTNAELVIVLKVFLDQIDSDPRASQWFDSRLVARANAALSPSPASAGAEHV